MPTIIQWPSPLFGYPTQGTHGRLGKTAQSICYHTMAGGWSYYTRIIAGQIPDIRNSANYSVNLDGTIHQHVADGDSAWCNGVDFTLGYDRYQSLMSIPWMAEAWRQRVSPNCYTISIECEGLGDQNAMPEAQYQAILWLTREIRARNPNVNLVWGEGLLGHVMIDHQKVRCPGRYFPKDRLIADLTKEQAMTATEKATCAHIASVVEESNSKIEAKLTALEALVGPLPMATDIRAFQFQIHNHAVHNLRVLAGIEPGEIVS